MFFQFRSKIFFGVSDIFGPFNRAQIRIEVPDGEIGEEENIENGDDDDDDDYDDDDDVGGKIVESKRRLFDQFTALLLKVNNFEHLG